MGVSFWVDTMHERHGKSYDPVYLSWASMKRRCNNPSTGNYRYYGAKGIKVCERWNNSFLLFLGDMGEPGEGETLDRRDPYKGYCKENCRWASKSVQGYNKRKSSRNTSGKVGVVARRGGWYVSISVNKKRLSLGDHKTFEEAVRVREEAELKYYGNIKE